jgi:ubiquinone biosynthesis protein UbiJ
MGALEEEVQQLRKEVEELRARLEEVFVLLR